MAIQSRQGFALIHPSFWSTRHGGCASDRQRGCYGRCRIADISVDDGLRRGVRIGKGARNDTVSVFSETWGTFLLVVVGAGAGVVAAKSGGTVTLGMAVVAPGLMVMAIIYFMGTVSGAHLNPAVTIAFAVRRNFPWRRVPGYILGQIAGGVAAAIFLRAMFGTAGELSATEPGANVSPLQALLMEVLLTAGLVNTILGTALGARNVGSNGAIAVGSYIALAGLWAAPISGASMNPVRSFAPDLVREEFGTAWIYLTVVRGSTPAVSAPH